MRAAAGSAYETEQAEKARLAEQETALAEASAKKPVEPSAEDTAPGVTANDFDINQE